MKDKFDIILKNGIIVDGTGADKYIADVGIKGKRIVKIGNLEGVKCEKLIEAKDLIVTPGFIDAHSHADHTLLIFPNAESCIHQGITTVVGGNCGFSPAPLKNKWLMSFWEFDFWDQVVPHFYGYNTIQPLEKVIPIIKKETNLDINWRTFGEYLDCVSQKQISVNLVPLVGHCQVRASVMGDDSSRIATDEEIEEMKSLVKEAMRAGAYGFSSGLSYPPGVFSDKKELTDIARVVKEYDGLYATHFNRVDLKTGKGTKIRGIEEAIEIGKETGIKLQISHIYNGYDIYPEPSDSMILAATNATLEIIDEAEKDGVDIAFDIIPNVDGGIALMPNLLTLVYAWYEQSGTTEQFIRNIEAIDYRQSIVDYIESGKWYLLNPKSDPSWDDNITIIQCENKSYIGKTLREISNTKNMKSLDVIFEILKTDINTKVKNKIPGLYHQAIKAFMKHPKAMIGSDTFALDKKGIYGVKKPKLVNPHPNTYGAFVKYLCDYGQPRIEDTIRKATGLPAQWFGIENRGLIKENYYADITIINTNQLDPKLNYVEPRTFPEGIEYVIVNGSLTLKKNSHTGKRAGKLLRKNYKKGDL